MAYVPSIIETAGGDGDAAPTPQELAGAFRCNGRVWTPQRSEHAWATIVRPVLLRGVVAPTSGGTLTTATEYSKLTALLPLLFEKLIGSQAPDTGSFGPPVISVDSSKAEGGSLQVMVAMASMPPLSAREAFEVDTPLGSMTLRITELWDTQLNEHLSHDGNDKDSTVSDISCQQEPCVLLLDIPGEWLELVLLEEACCAALLDADDTVPGLNGTTRWRAWLAQFGDVNQLRVSAHTTGAEGRVHLVVEYADADARRRCEEALASGHLIALKESGSPQAAFPRVERELRREFDTRAREAWGRLVMLENEISSHDKALVADEAATSLPAGPAGRCLRPLLELLLVWIERGVLNATETLRVQLRLQDEKGSSRGAPPDLFRHACWDAALHAALRLPRDSFERESDRLALVLCEHWREAYGLCADPDEEDTSALVKALRLVTEARGREERELFESAEAEARSAEEDLLKALEEEEGSSVKARDRLARKKQKEREKRKERLQQQRIEEEKRKEREQALRATIAAPKSPGTSSNASPSRTGSKRSQGSPGLKTPPSYELPTPCVEDHAAVTALESDSLQNEDQPRQLPSETKSSSPTIEPSSGPDQSSVDTESLKSDDKSHEQASDPKSGCPVTETDYDTQQAVQDQGEAVEDNVPITDEARASPAGAMPTLPRRERWSDAEVPEVSCSIACPQRPQTGPVTVPPPTHQKIQATRAKRVETQTSNATRQSGMDDAVFEAVRKSQEMNRRPPPFNSSSPFTSSSPFNSSSPLSAQTPLQQLAYVQPAAPTPSSPSRRRRGGKKKSLACASDVSTASGDGPSLLPSSVESNSPRERTDPSSRAPGSAITWKDLGDDVVTPVRNSAAANILAFGALEDCQILRHQQQQHLLQQQQLQQQHQLMLMQQQTQQQHHQQILQQQSQQQFTWSAAPLPDWPLWPQTQADVNVDYAGSSNYLGVQSSPMACGQPMSNSTTLGCTSQPLVGDPACQWLYDVSATAVSKSATPMDLAAQLHEVAHTPYED